MSSTALLSSRQVVQLIDLQFVQRRSQPPVRTRRNWRWEEQVERSSPATTARHVTSQHIYWETKWQRREENAFRWRTQTYETWGEETKNRNETITFVIMPVNCFFGLRGLRLLGGGKWGWILRAWFLSEDRDNVEQIWRQKCLLQRTQADNGLRTWQTYAMRLTFLWLPVSTVARTVFWDFSKEAVLFFGLSEFRFLS